MERKFLTQFIDKILKFPNWVKEILYSRLSSEVEVGSITYIFADYKPVLTYKGRCELDFKKSGFDTNTYNLLDLSDKDCSIFEIMVNTYLSMEEIAKYFLFCVDEGFLEIPDDSQILNIAGFLGGKYRTGEYFVNDGTISQTQLDDVVSTEQKSEKKFGQRLIDAGFISQKQLDMILKIKNEAKKRFILDHNEVPKIEQVSEYEKQIEELKQENKQLKQKLEQLLTIVRKDND
jgi:hypothetical protein